MPEITLHIPSPEETTWINARYAEVDFVQSEYDKESLVIAKIDNERAGLGRIVHVNDTVKEIGGVYVFEGFRGLGVARKVVEHLCGVVNSNDYDTYVLPYADLREFYQSFGFKEVQQSTKIPEALDVKWKYCQSAYEKKVLLMKRM